MKVTRQRPELVPQREIILELDFPKLCRIFCTSLQFSWGNYWGRGVVFLLLVLHQWKEWLWLNSQINYKSILSGFGIKDWGAFSHDCRCYLGGPCFDAKDILGLNTLLLWLPQLSTKKVLIDAMQFDLSVRGFCWWKSTEFLHNK